MDTRVKPAYDELVVEREVLIVRSHFVSANAVGVLPVTCRKA